MTDRPRLKILYRLPEADIGAEAWCSTKWCRPPAPEARPGEEGASWPSHMFDLAKFGLTHFRVIHASWNHALQVGITILTCWPLKS